MRPALALGMRLRLPPRAMALAVAMCVSGCMLPPPGHRVALVVDGALIATGIALAATASEPGPDSGGHLYRQNRVGGLVVAIGVIGALGTFLMTAIADDTKPSAKRAKPAPRAKESAPPP